MIGAAAHDRDAPGDRADVDNAPFPRPPHRRQRKLTEPHGAEHVGFKLAAQDVERYLLDRTVLTISRIVDEDADGSEARLDGFDRGASGRFVGDVERKDLAADSRRSLSAAGFRAVA